MSIISCPNCGNSISSEATICPKCQKQTISQSNNSTSVNNSVYRDDAVQQIPSIGSWIVNFLISIIPIIGFIFIIIWANDDNNKIRKNWAIASLIWYGIIFILSIMFYSIIIARIMRPY
jgi:hypothetical protein